MTSDRSRQYRRRFWILGLGFAAVFFASFLLGRYAVTPGTLFRVLSGALLSPVDRLLGTSLAPAATWSGREQAVILNIPFSPWIPRNSPSGVNPAVTFSSTAL